MEKQYKIELSASLDNLARVRGLIDEAGQRAGLIGEGLSAFKLAVDEGLTNIIVHGYAGNAEGRIQVTLEQAPGWLRAVLLDQARVFDPTQHAPLTPPPPFGRPAPGGMGIYLMHQGTDALTHRARPGGGNELILEKQIPSGPNAA